MQYNKQQWQKGINNDAKMPKIIFKKEFKEKFDTANFQQYKNEIGSDRNG